MTNDFISTIRLEVNRRLVNFKFDDCSQVHDNAASGIFLEDHRIFGEQEKTGKFAPVLAGTPDPNHYRRALNCGQQLSEFRKINTRIHTTEWGLNNDEHRNVKDPVIQEGGGDIY